MQQLSHKRLIICLFILLSPLTGCDRATPEAVLENYQYRISNVLDIPNTHNYKLETRPLFPPRRDRILRTTELREGLLDVLKLKDCHLIPLIAERNSSLGKVYAPSQKMRYELQFYHLLRLCRLSLVDSTTDKAFIERLKEIQRIKHKNLPSELWNGVFTSKEIEMNFARDKAPLPLLDNGSSAATFEALRSLIAIIRTPLEEQAWSPPKELPKLESFYETLNKNQSGPKILSALQLVTLHLNIASTTLEEGMAKHPLCFQQKPTRNAKIMKNIFYKYYIGEVQPYLAVVHRNANEWLDLNNHLIDSFREFNLIVPKQLETYQRMVLSKSEQHSLWSNYIRARDKHTKSWQKLLKQCGMMPTK